MNYNTCQEKKASNDLVQRSKKEAINEMAVANSLVSNSIRVKKSAEEMELRQ